MILVAIVVILGTAAITIYVTGRICSLIIVVSITIGTVSLFRLVLTPIAVAVLSLF